MILKNIHKTKNISNLILFHPDHERKHQKTKQNAEFSRFPFVQLHIIDIKCEPSYVQLLAKAKTWYRCTVKRCLESGTDAQERHVLKPNSNTIKADRRKATYSWSRQASPPKTGIHTTSKMINISH